jgi:uncharacterized protein involved in exopolysaccharide biosynthesis
MKQQVAQIASLEKTVLEIQERIWQKQREQNTAGLAEEMKRLQEEADATFLEDWEKRQGEQEVKLRDAQTLAEAEMKRLFDVRGGMEDDLAQLRDLTAKYEEYKTERESKARQMEEQDNKVVDIAAARVQVSDSPYVSQQPYNYHPFLYMAAGCGGGLFVGILLALALEIFSRKVRFKHDIIADYGLPVVGVVPRRNY